MAPCCCRYECRDTKTFVELAHLNGDQSYLKQCRSQLSAVNITFSSVDYGFQLQKLSKADIAGIAISSVAFVATIFTYIYYKFCCSSKRKTPAGSPAQPYTESFQPYNRTSNIRSSRLDDDFSFLMKSTHHFPESGSRHTHVPHNLYQPHNSDM